MQFTSTNSEKNHYSFKELSSLTGIKPYVLRFWESEFEQIRPFQNEDGTKSYSSWDKANIEKIKDLLFEQKLSIPEAKAILDSTDQAKETNSETQLVDEIVGEVILDHLGQRVFSHQSSLEMMKTSLASDLAQSPPRSGLSVDYTEKDMLQLLHAKKKLNGILKRVEGVCQKYHW